LHEEEDDSDLQDIEDDDEDLDEDLDENSDH
jgi:hypothetical protein